MLRVNYVCRESLGKPFKGSYQRTSANVDKCFHVHPPRSHFTNTDVPRAGERVEQGGQSPEARCCGLAFALN